MIATICLYALISVSESVSVKFSALYLVSKVSEKVVSVHLSCGTDKRNHCRAVTIKMAYPALGKNKALLSPLSRFNKTL